MSGGIWTGTNVFQSVKAAIRYYRDYGFDAQDVREKIARSEIVIGRLKRAPGTFVICDKGRWFYRGE